MRPSTPAIPTAARRRELNAPMTFFQRPLSPGWGAVWAPAGRSPNPGDTGHGVTEFPGASRTPSHSQSAAAPPGLHLHPPWKPPAPFGPSSSPPGLTVTCQRPAAQRAPPDRSRPRLDPCGSPSARGAARLQPGPTRERGAHLASLPCRPCTGPTFCPARIPTCFPTGNSSVPHGRPPRSD